jgi:hypothetical protein
MFYEMSWNVEAISAYTKDGAMGQREGLYDSVYGHTHALRTTYIYGRTKGVREKEILSSGGWTTLNFGLWDWNYEKGAGVLRITMT